MTDTKIREVHPGVFVVHLPLPMKPTIVNVTLLRAGDGWVLIDTGANTNDSIDAVFDALHQVGCPPDHLRAIIATHHHPDHYGGSQTIKDRTGAKVYIHPKEVEAADHYAPRRQSEEAIRFFRSCGLPIDRYGYVMSAGEFWAPLWNPAGADHLLVDGEVLPFGRFEIEVVATPGHTPGHCALYLRRERLMIVGDHLLPKITPHVGFLPGGSPNPLGDFLDSQRKVQKYDVSLVLPAHGGTYSDHRHRANQIIHHHEYRLREMFDVVKSRSRTAYEVASAAWGFDIDSPLQVQFPATFEALAHLEYLRAEGRLEREGRGELVYYRAV